MDKKFLCLFATFDEETNKKIKEIENVIKESGIDDKQTPNLPPHITIAYFYPDQVEDVKQLLNHISYNTNCFNLDFNHLGLFGLKVLFLAPDVNYELLDLHKSFDGHSIKSDKGWTAHSTILINDSDMILKALPLVEQCIKPISSRVVSLSLYEFFPTRLIEVYNLQ